MSKPNMRNEPEESNRMWASASFVGVLIVIGLPLWWKTTEVYRVALPYDKISSFDSLPHKISTELVVLANDEATAAEIAGLIEKTFQGSDVLNVKVTKEILSAKLHETLDSVADELEALEEVSSHFDLGIHNRFLVVQRKPLFQDVWLGTERLVFFRDARAATSLAQALQHWVYQTSVLRGARADIADAARRTRFPPGDHYHIVLSVVQPRPDTTAVEFDAQEAVEDYIGSFVDELSVLHNFTLKSQWLYLLEFHFQGSEVKDTSDWGRHFSVRQESLPLLLTRLEERAATRVSDSPTVNLALYNVPCEGAPLAIYDDERDFPENPLQLSQQAFLSPQWGGVVLSNPTVNECEARLHRPLMRHVMGAFISQLRKLLGIVDAEPIQSAHVEPLRGVSPRRWEVDNLLRLRTIEQLTSAERTLQSLAQLLGEISNIVINDDVGASVNLAVESIHSACELLQKGNLVEAYRTSQKAFTAAETAFMDPSLLALLYFPDDQKYAIYIPLFLPIMFPVILSLKNLLLWFRGKPVHQKTD